MGFRNGESGKRKYNFSLLKRLKMKGWRAGRRLGNADKLKRGQRKQICSERRKCQETQYSGETESNAEDVSVILLSWSLWTDAAICTLIDLIIQNNNDKKHA